MNTTVFSSLAEATASELHGTKATTLARLQAAGVAVPPSVVIPAHARPDFAAAADAVCEWARELGAASLVVRSSASNEDGTTSSFAGVYRSHFTPTHATGIREALHDIHDGPHTALACAYATARHQPDTDHGIATLVQPALRPIAAGVLAAEVSSARLLGAWRIELVRGLAEPLTSGRVTGEIHAGTGTTRAPRVQPANHPTVVLPATVDELTVPPGDWLPMPTLTGAVQAKVDTSGNGLIHLHTPPEHIASAILTPTARGRLLALTRTVAHTLDIDRVDIEWVLDQDGTITVIQARPLTTAMPPTDEPGPDRTGLPAAPGAGRGPVVHLRPDLSPTDVQDAVLVCDALDTDTVALLLHHPAALIATTGGPLSHTAIIARELSIPCVTNVTDAYTTYPPGTAVHVDGTTGTITTAESPQTTPPNAPAAPPGDHLADDLTDTVAILTAAPPHQPHNGTLIVVLHRPGHPPPATTENGYGLFQPTSTPNWPDECPIDSRDVTLPGLGRLLLPAGLPVPQRIVAPTPQHRPAHQRLLWTHPQPRHIVWDWNGTLLDDNTAALAGVNAFCHAHNRPPVTLREWRALLQRPARAAYERLLGRGLADDEWDHARHLFRRSSQAIRRSCQLAADAELCLRRWRSLGGTQSLLSLTPHNELVNDIAARNLTELFTAVHGLPDTAIDSKTAQLSNHLAETGHDPSTTVMIGDSEDDAAAAREIGTHAILYARGTTSRTRLDATGYPVVDTLTDTLQLITPQPAQP